MHYTGGRDLYRVKKERRKGKPMKYFEIIFWRHVDRNIKNCEK